MSLDSVFKPEQKRKNASCAGMIGAFIGFTLVYVGLILLVAWAVFTGVEEIGRDGWTYGAVVRLTAALLLVSYWFRRSK